VLAWNPVIFAVVILLSLGMILFSMNYAGVMDMVIAAIFGW
jgi:hypothetical protein